MKILLAIRRRTIHFPQNGARPTDSNAENPSAEDAGNSVAVRKLPTVSIGKDWADWSYWGFGGILVIVGSFQVWFLYGTLRAIKAQSGHMERQTKILEDSVAAAQKSADAAAAQIEMMKRKERAQLSIEFAEPEWTFNEELRGYPIRFQVTLEGNTRAYVPQSVILAYMARTARTKRTAWRDMGLPRRLTPEMSPFEGYTLISKDDGWPEADTDLGRTDLVQKKNFTVFVDGAISYRDIFGDEWTLEIDRCWVPNSRHGGDGATGGMWVPFGSGIHDTHRKVEYNKQEQPQNPN
jgi:hypothetical protein